jgi:chemotaxis signal transduction protein
LRDSPSLEQRAAELRQAFDESFAARPNEAPPRLEDMLAVRVAGDRYAIALSDVAALVARPVVVAAPVHALGFVGLFALRGAVIPVFGLDRLLGYAAEPGAPRWAVVARNEDPIAFAFSVLDGHLRLAASEVRPATDADPAAALQSVADQRPVIALHRLIASIRARPTTHTKEPRSDG